MQPTPSIVTYPNLGSYGRLGNQMFEIASTIGIADRSGLTWAFPDWTYSKFFESNLPSAFTGNLDQKRYAEPSFHDHVDVQLNEKFGVEHQIYGHRQNEKYFSHCSNLIRNVFKFKGEIVERVKNRIADLDDDQTVCVHIRRGDYVNLSHLYVNLFNSTTYYQDAAKQFKFSRTVFFSDDIKWCQSVMKPSPVVKYEFSTMSEVEDLIAMSLAKNLIISNSTFAWWAAWLNQTQDRKVVCPARWFTPMMGGDEVSRKFHHTGWIIV